MARNYPKNRQGISGKPFPRRTSHKTECYWCGSTQDIELMTKLMSDKKCITYPCDKCARRMRVYVTAEGFFSSTPADRTRYLRNKLKGTNRI